VGIELASARKSDCAVFARGIGDEKKHRLLRDNLCIRENR